MGQWGGFALLALLALAALHPALQARFVLVDDHEILSFSPAARQSVSVGAPPSLVERIVRVDAPNGRLRPLYWVIRMAEIAVLGQRPGLWHAVYLVMGVMAACLFYRLLGAVGVLTVPALAAGSWLLVAPGVSSIWIRLGPQESLGTVLLLVSAFAAARGALTPGRAWDAAFAAALIAALLVKESFVLAAPAMIGLRLFLRHLQGRREDRRWPSLVPAAAAALVLLLAWGLAARAGTASYGGKYLAAPLPGVGDAVNLLVLALLGGIVTPLLAAGPLAAWLRRRATVDALRAWMVGASLVLLLLAPQLVLYRGGGFVVDRYVVPASLGLTMGVAAGCAWLVRARLLALASASMALWLALIAIGTLGTWRTAEVFRADSTQLQRLVQTIDTAAPRNSILGIAADPAYDAELAISLRYHVVATGRGDLDVRLLLPASGSGETATSLALRAMLVERDFPGQHTITGDECQRTWGIALLTSQPPGTDAWACPTRPIPASLRFQEVVSSPILTNLFPDVTVGYGLATLR